MLHEQHGQPIRVKYGQDRGWTHHQAEVFRNNPKIVHPFSKEGVEFWGRVNGLRPYCVEKTATRWRWREYKPIIGELYLEQAETEFAETLSLDVVLEPNVKGGASPNKDWGWVRWEELARLLFKEGLHPAHLGPQGTKRLNCARFVETRTFRQACAALTKAKVAVLHEGGLHHAAAVAGVPAVVLYGGFISPRQTGYDSQVNLFTGGEPCGWRTRCAHCDSAMAKITPEEVFYKTMELLRG